MNEARGSGVRAALTEAEGWQNPDAQLIRQGFEVEVLCGGEPLEKYVGRGRYYIEALKNAEYELLVRNPLPVRVAVALSVDGLNTIDARHKTAREASKWVIEPYGEITVTGWQMSSTRARRFYFTSEPDAYATKLGRPSDIGIISAVFFREREPITQNVAPTPPPRPLKDLRRGGEDQSSAGAPSIRAERQSAQKEQAIAPPRDNDEYAATGIGRSVNNDVTWIHLNLDDRPAAEMIIRYEYRPALIRLGVLPRSSPEPDPLHRRERARGFRERTYCPEP